MDPAMHPDDYRIMRPGGHMVYDSSRALLYPIPQTGSAAQDDAYARWFLYAVVQRHKHHVTVLEREEAYLYWLRDLAHESFFARENYTGALRLMHAIHDHQIDQIRATINARLAEVRARLERLEHWVIHTSDSYFHGLEDLLREAQYNGKRYVDILLDYIHAPDRLRKLIEQAELPDDDSDPEFGPYLDALDGIEARWLYRSEGNLHRIEAHMDYEGGWDDFGGSVYFNDMAPRGEGRFVASEDGHTYYEFGRRAPRADP